MIRPYCFSLLTPPRNSLLGPYHGICGFFVVSAPDKLYIRVCLSRSNAFGNQPSDVPPAVTRTTVMLTFAKPAVVLNRVGACLNVDMPLGNKCFTEFRELYRYKPYKRQKDYLEVQL